MNNIYVFGECMVELRADKALNSSQNSVSAINSSESDASSKILKQSFAGDVINTAIYLKRTFPELNAHFVSAIGKDVFSSDMLSFIKKERIGSQFVFQSEHKIPGLYAIETDDTGERTFTYWRENSAARDIMQFIEADHLQAFNSGDVFFYSGISLAVIQPHDRAKFWTLIRQLKSKNVSIVFDPNYRARMWQTPKHAQQQFELAFEHADIALPGVDDFVELYGLNTTEQVYQFCQQYNLKELIIKNGPAQLFISVNGHNQTIDITPVENVVDTTSAGDSFNGVYLGARMQGIAVEQAIELASRAAGFVIQHKGAIVPAEIFQHFVEQQLLLPTS